MKFWAAVFFTLLLAACAPTTPRQHLPSNCLANSTQERLLAGNWLKEVGVWRLRQSALLELGMKKIPLEGFLRLDLQKREARLLAMNELGLVLFDLQVGEQDERLLRAVPQVANVKGFAKGVAQSLRQIFLLPRPKSSDRLHTCGNVQRLWRQLPGGDLGFVFDCWGDLRETRQEAKGGDWRVAYDDYREFADGRLPERIVLNDYRHRLKLSLWLREVKREP